MTASPGGPRGRNPQMTLAYVGLGLAVVILLGGAVSMTRDTGGWAVARLVVALLYAGYAVWFFLRARRRERARQPGPPG